MDALNTSRILKEEEMNHSLLLIEVRMLSGEAPPGRCFHRGPRFAGPKDPGQVQEPEACLKGHSGVVVCEQLRPKLFQTTSKSKRHFWWEFPLEYSDTQFQWVIFPHQTIFQHQLGV